jgi:hypothetical protein
VGRYTDDPRLEAALLAAFEPLDVVAEQVINAPLSEVKTNRSPVDDLNVLPLLRHSYTPFLRTSATVRRSCQCVR